MKVTEEGIGLICKFEGFSSKAYKCPAGVWTIGFGNTYYADGTKVKMGDTIDREGAYQLLKITVERFSNDVKKLLKVTLNENQFSALVSFAYNVGVANLKSSTLLRKVNINPSDPTIRNEFNKWVFAGGKKLNGLVRRRQAEGDLYCEKC